MAKAPSLRKDWNKGTQRTRKLSAGNARGMLREWEETLRGTQGSRRRIAGAKPGAVKAASPVVCPAKAGVFSRRETYQGKSQSPVARSAGGRETNLLKPLDSLICGMGVSLQAVAQANAQVAPQVIAPEAEPATGKAKAAWAVADWLRRRTTPAGWERQHGDKDTLSNWRDPPRPAAKSAEAR